MRLQYLSYTVPSKTPFTAANPLVADFFTTVDQVVAVTIYTPANTLNGIAIRQNAEVIMPSIPPAWFYSVDGSERIDLNTEGFPGGGTWGAQTYPAVGVTQAWSWVLIFTVASHRYDPPPPRAMSPHMTADDVHMAAHAADLRGLA